MTEELNGLFNPFYATAGTDMDIVGMTQIGMLTTDDNGNTTCGENEATVVLDYEISESNGNSVYTFVLKNDILFSDGYALTMNDVLFNMYEYLDPVYTGSSTMYSTKIVGLDAYRMPVSYTHLNLTKATTTPAYLTTFEGDRVMDKTKLELKDDKNKTGVYEMTFAVNNISQRALTYLSLIHI